MFLNGIKESICPGTVVLLVKVAVIDLLRYATVVLWWMDGAAEEVWKILNVDVAVDIIKSVHLSDVGLCVGNIFVHVEDSVLRRERIVRVVLIVP